MCVEENCHAFDVVKFNFEMFAWLIDSLVQEDTFQTK